MYLSKLKLNTHCVQVRKDVGSPHSMHRTIMRAFPAPLPHDERVLFRVESFDLGEVPLVLVQSQAKPEWGCVENEFKGYFADLPQVKDLAGLRIDAGDILRFRLRANPCKRVYYQRTGKSQRVSLFSEKDRRDWLVRKANASGFSIDERSLLIRDAPYRLVFIPKDERVIKATFNMVDYDGILQVKDGQKFMQSVSAGIGAAKGLGCGLLSFAQAL